MRIDALGSSQQSSLGGDPDAIEGSEIGLSVACIGHVMEIAAEASDAGNEGRGVHIGMASTIPKAHQTGLRVADEFRSQCTNRHIVDIFRESRGLKSARRDHVACSRS